MRRIALAALAATALALFAAFTVTESPRPGVVGPDRTLCAEPAAMRGGLPPAVLAAGCSGGPYGAVACRTAAFRTAAFLTAGDPGPRGWISDLVRRIRRILRAVRDAIDAVLEHTNDGKDDPGSTIGTGGLPRAEALTPGWPAASA